MAWADGYRDADAARDEVSAWMRGVAAKRGWTSAQTSAALQLVTDAYSEADAAEFLGVTLPWDDSAVKVFWNALARGVQRPEFRGYPEWQNVADTVRQALVSVGSEEATRFDTSWYGGVLGGTAAAVADVAAAGGEVVDKATRPTWVWGVAVALVALAVILKVPARRA